MVAFGIDISHHQDLGLDLARCRRDGIEFAFIKSTEGSTFVDPEFTANLAEARAAGLLVAAYHYVRSGASAAAQVANVRRVVPRDVPVIPDVETGSGGVTLLHELVTQLRADGYRVPLTYLPRWYWQQLGQPSLVGLPPLWSSRYPDTIVGTLSDEWADVPAHYWNGYGGLAVAVLQFTSSATIAGYQPLDANAFNGTRQQLERLLRGGTVALQDEVFTFTRASDGQTVSVNALDMLGNLYAMTFYGSTSEPWAGPSIVEHLKGLTARPVGNVDVDEAALAVAIANELESNGVVGITPEQVETAVRNVFADAGSDDAE